MLDMKPWYQSKTVWGALIAIAAPLLGQAGLEVGGAEQAEIADALTTLAGTVGGLLALYGRLRRHCPAPFAGLAIAGEEAVLSASPERFLRLEADGRVETRPIKGTRPRHREPGRDADAADLGRQGVGDVVAVEVEGGDHVVLGRTQQDLLQKCVGD